MELDKILNIIYEFAATVGIRLLCSVLLLLVGIRLIRWLKKFIRTSPRLSKVDTGVRSFISGFSTIALYIVLFITIAMILGIPTTSFIAALASGFAAIGLAMQGALSNFAGGLMILIFHPFKVGDYISTPDAEGTVDDITVVYTILRTPDNKMVTVPNGTLTNSVVQNYTAEKTRRVDLTFSTGYECDVEKVKSVIMKAVNAHPLVLRDPEPTVRLSEHADSALVYKVKVWCATDDYWDVHFDLMEQVTDEFERSSISIPYPQLDIHIDK